MLSKEIKVGDTTQFTFREGQFSIREILEVPEISMWWNWNTTVCPHCRKRIENRVCHKFHRIIILGLDPINNDDINKEDLIFIGDTIDNRRMSLDDITVEKVLQKSTIFKRLVN